MSLSGWFSGAPERLRGNCSLLALLIFLCWRRLGYFKVGGIQTIAAFLEWQGIRVPWKYLMMRQIVTVMQGLRKPHSWRITDAE